MSILARQVNRVVREIESDFRQRKIREFQLLREYDIVIAVVACERSRVVGVNFQRPYLKLLGRDGLNATLRERDFVKQPVRASPFGNELRALGVEHVAIDRMSKPAFTAGELRQIVCLKCVGHDGLSVCVTPTAGAREARHAAGTARPS